jgi:predicted nucleotide-binding protein (sugar kinase/HSP70/actin superfamily)
MVRIGIPRALLYFQYLPLWQTFFQVLGAELVVSPPTTKETLAAGAARVVADTCLPVKVFLGHVISLSGKCDYVFIPAIRSLKGKTYNCSKFLGLPDLTGAVIPEGPPILETDIDAQKGRWGLYRSIYNVGRHFTGNPLRIRQAALSALKTYRQYRKLMQLEHIDFLKAMARIPGRDGDQAELSDRQNPPRMTIALIGHPYLLYDEHINHNIISRLERAGCRVRTPEMASPENLKSAVNTVAGNPYWTYEEDVVGAGGHYLQKDTDGVIGIMAFGCGPDSLMMDVVRRRASHLGNTPFMILTLDEHTGETGLITRLEAFLNMIQRRKRRQLEICA